MKKTFSIAANFKQFLIHFYWARELKQSTYNLLKALLFLEIFLLLLTVMTVELNLPSFKQNRSVNGYFLNRFPLGHYNNWLQVTWEHYNLYRARGSEGIETLQ